MNLTGFSMGRTIYVLASLTNKKSDPITFFTTDNNLTYPFGNETVELNPIRPKNLDKSHFSFFNSIIRGAGSISNLLLNVPVDKLIKTGDRARMSVIGEEYHDDEIEITKKIFISNHTIFPETNYSGFLVFEYKKDKPVLTNPFIVKIKLDDKEFTASGKLIY